MNEAFSAIVDFLSHPIWQTIGLFITLFGLERFIRSPQLGNIKAIWRPILRWGSLFFPVYVIYYLTLLIFSWSISERWVLLRVSVAIATLLGALWGAYWGKALNNRFAEQNMGENERRPIGSDM